jgi:hypothetical protein
MGYIMRMARPLDGATPKDQSITFRATKSTHAALDRQRGQMSRADYLARLIVKDGQTRKDSTK